MNFKKYTALFLLLILMQLNLSAQNIINLSAPETGTIDHVARQEINFLQGYTYTPSTAAVMHAYIDANLVGDASYTGTFYSDISQQRTINTQNVVGLTQGNASVTDMGGASYSIGLSLPMGTMGLMPTVGVSYNSHGGNGLLGMGWNLSAGSAIMRSGQTIYHNGETEGVLLNNDDVFVLDGMRLIPTSGNNGAAGTIYATEQESFSRITSLGISGTGPASFKVETKDGKTIEYGIDNQARLKGLDGSTVIVWYIRKVTDLNGNYLEYKYTIKEDQTVLDEILYTGNAVANLSPYNKIKFYYNKRSDVNSSYIAGKEIKSSLVLDRVSISTEDKMYREYQFVYSYRLYSFLTEVIEFGSDGSRFNSTAFQYGATPPDETTGNTTLSVQGASVDIFPGDYNGDGITDVISSEFIAVGEIKIHFNMNLYKGTSTGGLSLVSSQALSPQSTITSNFFNQNQANSSFTTCDFDSDGKDDFISTKQVITGTIIPLRKVTEIAVNYSQGTSFGAAVSYPVDAQYNSVSLFAASDNFLSIGDFDGDGAQDFITFLTKDGVTLVQPKIYFPRRNEAIVINDATLANNFFTARQLMVVDFDGDGKSEVMMVSDTEMSIYEFTKNGSFISAAVIYQSSVVGASYQLWPADFNGDGKTDILARGSTGIWQVSYSTGKSFVNTIVDLGDARQGIIPIIFQMGNIKIGDYNGDGKNDIMYLNVPTISVPNTLRKIWYSNGMGFSAPALSSYNSVMNIFQTYPGDFNGDGQMDDIYYKEGTTASITLFNKESNALLLQKASDGFNNVQEFRYQPITSSQVYSKTTSYSYPLYVASFPLSVVSSHKQLDGNGGINETTYQYENAVMHKSGKGFLGFFKTTASNVLTNRKIISSTLLNLSNGFYTPTSQSTVTQQLTTSQVLSSSTNFFTCSALGGRRYWCFVSQNNSWDYIKGVKNNQTNEYNNTYGNLTKSTITVADWAGTTIQTSVNETQYAQFATWIPSHPVTVSSTTTRTGEVPVSRTKSFSYNTKGNIVSSISDVGDAKQVTTTINAYNNFGQALSQTTSAAGVTSITTSLEYDNKGRDVLKKYNPLNQFESYTYDNFGRALSYTDIVGLTTTNVYDGFGRLTKTTLPTGVVSNQTLSWQINNGANTSISDISTVYSLTKSATNAPTTQTWFDALGREKIAKTQRLSSADVYIHKMYNNLGNVKWQTTPHFLSDIPVYTSYLYDDILYRVTEMNMTAISTPTTYAYTDGSGLSSVTVTSPQGTTTQVTDATGLVKSSTDNGGTLDYIYYSSGNLKSVTLAGTEMVSMEYDLQGNKTKMTDKNAGVISYDYDAFGKLINQNDNGKVISMQYDAAGRVTQKTNAEGTTTYEYNSDGKALNAVKKVIGVGGMQQDYTYSTDFGRLIKIDEKVGAENFSTQYEYDNFGNQTKVIYPSGFVVKNVFNSIGEMYKITDNTESITIWQRTATNEYGNYTEYTTGNGKTTKKEYDIYGLPKRFSAVGVYDIQMNFNAETGNLTSRKDNLLNLNENFTYDNLNRLTSSQVVGQAIMNIAYANNGNIQSKSDVGNYSYDQNKVNAVAKITPPIASDLNSSVISQQDQLIEYTSFNKAKKLTENGYELTISYGVDEMRRKGEMKQNGVVIQTRYYLPRYEKTIEGTSTIEVNYISTPDGVIAMYVQENGASAYHYVYRDHLRTPLVVTSGTGVIEYKQSYDAWGKSRNPNNWTYDMSTYTVARPTWMYRGFTGHEHLPQFTLINMNGRMYDPITGRMLSVDDFIQAGDYSQSYNRYSYVWNNPLRYMDPTGYITWWDIGAGAAMVTGTVLVATGAGAALGGALIFTGFSHFANTTNNYYANKDNGGTWNQASTQAGITFSYTATVNMSGTGNNHQLNQQKVRESDELLIGVGYSPPVASNYNGLNEYASADDFIYSSTMLINPSPLITAVTTEQVVDKIMKLQMNKSLTGKELASYSGNSNFVYIDYVTRTKGGFKLDLSSTANTSIWFTDLVVKDNSQFNVYPTARGYHIVSPGNKIYFDNELVDFNIFIAEDLWSTGYNMHKSQNTNTK